MSAGDEIIGAYVDGELRGDALRSFAIELQASARLQARVRDLQHLKQQLRAAYADPAPQPTPGN